MNRLLLVKQKKKKNYFFNALAGGGEVDVLPGIFGWGECCSVFWIPAVFQNKHAIFHTLFQAWLLKYVFGLRAHYPISPREVNISRFYFAGTEECFRHKYTFVRRFPRSSLFQTILEGEIYNRVLITKRPYRSKRHITVTYIGEYC